MKLVMKIVPVLSRRKRSRGAGHTRSQCEGRQGRKEATEKGAREEHQQEEGIEARMSRTGGHGHVRRS
jgi:hypothetical protein